MKKFSLVMIAVLMLVLITSCSWNNPSTTFNPPALSPTPTTNTTDVPTSDVPTETPTETPTPTPVPTPHVMVNTAGHTITTRFNTPEGYARIGQEDGSYGAYLQNLPLRVSAVKAYSYDGNAKENDDYAAVVDMLISSKDQCGSDTVTRLRAEYFYATGNTDAMNFKFVSGFVFEYNRWINGDRISVDGSNVVWKEGIGDVGNTDKIFTRYLQNLYAYSNVTSLKSMLKGVSNAQQIKVGDVLVSAKNALCVVDVAFNASTGDTVIMLAGTSGTQSEDIQILKNMKNEDQNPWYSINDGKILNTPLGDFSLNDLMRWSE